MSSAASIQSSAPGVEHGGPGALRADWNVSLVGFGLPSDPRTFSGYALNLLRGLREAGAFRREFSAKNVHAFDALGGALLLKRVFPRPQVAISRKWMWSRRGNEVLSTRLNRAIGAAGDHGAFLEVGTLVRIDPKFGPHFQLTDMTIAQARRTGHFAIGALPASFLDEAEGVQREILAGAAHVFVLSDWTARSIIDDCGVPSDRVTVVYAGSNLRLLEGLVVPRKHHEILFVGIDWVRKGGPLLLEAFREVRKAIPDATLRIVGCDPWAEGGRPEQGVLVEGLLDRRDPTQYERLCRCYLEASVFCLPSRFDPFPNAIIEAMGVGLPAVAFDNGSRREAVVDGVTGFLAKDGDVADLARALVRILAEPERREAMGRSAQERVRSEFTWKRVVERIGAVVRGPRPTTT
jgi:glycosyltransferase involved in cell wall biosynthesis